MDQTHCLQLNSVPESGGCEILALHTHVCDRIWICDHSLRAPGRSWWLSGCHTELNTHAWWVSTAYPIKICALVPWCHCTKEVWMKEDLWLTYTYHLGLEGELSQLPVLPIIMSGCRHWIRIPLITFDQWPSHLSSAAIPHSSNSLPPLKLKILSSVDLQHMQVGT